VITERLGAPAEIRFSGSIWQKTLKAQTAPEITITRKQPVSKRLLVIFVQLNRPKGFDRNFADFPPRHPHVRIFQWGCSAFTLSQSEHFHCELALPATTSYKTQFLSYSLSFVSVILSRVTPFLQQTICIPVVPNATWRGLLHWNRLRHIRITLSNVMVTTTIQDSSDSWLTLSDPENMFNGDPRSYQLEDTRWKVTVQRIQMVRTFSLFEQYWHASPLRPKEKAICKCSWSQLQLLPNSASIWDGRVDGPFR